MSECTKFADDLKAYVDGELPMLQKRAVQRHIAGCALCRDEIAGMTQIGKELRLGESFELDPALRARLLAAVPESAPTLPRRSPMPRRFSFAFAGSVAAIAALIIIFKPAHDSFTPVYERQTSKAMSNLSAPADMPPAATMGGAKAKSPARPLNQFEDMAKRQAAPVAGPMKVESNLRQAQGDRVKAPMVFKRDNQESIKFAAPTVKDMEGLRKDESSAQANLAYRDSNQTGEARHRGQAATQKPAGNLLADSFNSSQASANLNLNNQGLAPNQPQNAPGTANRTPTLSETATAGGAAKSRGADTKSSTQDANNHFYSRMGVAAGGGRGAGGFGGGAKGDAGPKGDSGVTGLGANGNSDFAAATPGVMNGAAGPAGPAGLSAKPIDALSLRIEVTDLPQKRAAIDKIVKDANGKLTDLKDTKKLTTTFQETTLSLQVSEDSVKQVFGRLEQLGDVVEKSVPNFWDGIDKNTVKEQLDRRATSKLEEHQEAKTARKEATAQSRRVFDGNVGRMLSTRPRDYEAERTRGAVRLYSTIIVNLREKKPVQVDAAKSKPAGAAGQKKP